MEKKQPVTAYDFAHLETFLDTAYVRLTRGYAVDGDYDEKASLNAHHFFQGVSESARLDDFKSDPNYIGQVCAVLNKFMPSMFDALEKRGDDIQKVDLFEYWVEFMASQKATNHDRLDVVTTHGERLIYEAAIRNQISIAFDLLDISLNQFEEINTSSSDYAFSEQHDFIKNHSIKTLCAYALQTPNGLEQIEPSHISKNEKIYRYASYAAKAVKLYDQSLRIMKNVAEPAQQFFYAMNSLPEMSHAVSNAETGTYYKKDDVLVHKLDPDYKLRKEVLGFSLRAMAESGKYFGTFQEHVFNHVPDMMDEFVRHHHGRLCCELFDETIDMLDHYSQGAKEFATAFGARAAIALLKNNSGYSGNIMLSLRHRLDLDKSDVLFLMDPDKDETANPVAALVNINPNKNVDNDILLTFRENRLSVPFVKDNVPIRSNKKDIFLPGLWNGNAESYHLSRHLGRIILRADDPVHEPEVEKQSALLYSCRQYDLLLKG